MKKEKIIYFLTAIIIVVGFSYFIILANKEDTEYTKTEKALVQAMEFGESIYDKCVIGCLVIGTWVCVYFKLYDSRGRKKKKHRIKVVREKDIDYFRDLPQRIDLEPAFASLYYYSNISTRNLKNGLIGAFILRWSHENNIKIIDKGNQVFGIDLQDGNFQKTEYEQRLYTILKEAAGKNNILENFEFYSWSKSNNRKLNKWYEDILKEWDKRLKLDYCKKNLKLEAEALLGLKKFLLDYSLIDERRHKEVKIWENYLICAHLLGITDEVKSQFKEIYPENYTYTFSQVVVKTQELSIWALLFYIIVGLLVNVCAFLTTLIISLLYFIINLI